MLHLAEVVAVSKVPCTLTVKPLNRSAVDDHGFGLRFEHEQEVDGVGQSESAGNEIGVETFPFADVTQWRVVVAK